MQRLCTKDIFLNIYARNKNHIVSSYFSLSIMVRFFRGEVNPKGFFAPITGYSKWDFLNNEYQVNSIHYLRGWNRARLDFEGGLECKSNIGSIAKKYWDLQNVQLVYLDTFDECKFTYQIVIAFDKKKMSRQRIKEYHHWTHLNYQYGVKKIGHELGRQMSYIANTTHYKPLTKNKTYILIVI